MRIQRMLLRLQPYEFRIIHISGKSIGLADCLSRLPVGEADALLEDDLMVCPADSIAGKEHAMIVEATQEDPELKQLRKMIISGWPETKAELAHNVGAYWDYRDELSTYNGIVYKGNRIVIPTSMRKDMLKRIHKSHLGMVTSKQRAKDVIYWPGMNGQIEDTIRRCEICLKYRNKPPKEPMTIHPLPNGPWKKVASDIFELHSKHYIVLVDYYSNFIEVEPLDSLNTAAVIKFMKRNIARYGLFEELISNNGPQYSSSEFEAFMKDYGIQHTTSSPLYPQSNGLAEKAVQTIKMTLKKCKEAGEDPYLALLDLRNTPRDQNIGSPAQRLMGRRTKTQLPTSEALLKPAIVEEEAVTEGLMEHRMRQKYYYDRGSRPLPPIEPGSAIRVQTPEGWEPAEYIRKHDAPNSHIIKAGKQARLYRRNRSMIMTTKENPHVIQKTSPPFVPTPETYQQPANPPTPRIQQRPPSPDPPTPRIQQRTLPPPDPPTPPKTTRSGRVIRKPAWMKDMVVSQVYQYPQNR